MFFFWLPDRGSRTIEEKMMIMMMEKDISDSEKTCDYHATRSNPMGGDVDVDVDVDDETDIDDDGDKGKR